MKFVKCHKEPPQKTYSSDVPLRASIRRRPIPIQHRSRASYIPYIHPVEQQEIGIPTTVKRSAAAGVREDRWYSIRDGCGGHIRDGYIEYCQVEEMVEEVHM